MASFIRSDLEFILAQIMIAEANAAGTPLAALLPNSEVAFGLRTIDGSFNHVVLGETLFGAADLVFPRLTTPVFRTAENVTIDLDGPGPLTLGAPTSYAQTSGFVFDSQPRIISNLIVDMTATNLAAVAAAAQTPGSELVTGTRTDGSTFQTFFIPNIAADANMSRRARWVARRSVKRREAYAIFGISSAWKSLRFGVKFTVWGSHLAR